MRTSLGRSTGSHRITRRRAVHTAGVIAGVALLSAGCAVRVDPSASTSTSSAQPTPLISTVGPAPLGVNVAAWDALYASAGAHTIDGQLDTAGLRLLRYPGGSWADEYHWSNNTDSSTCPQTVTPACSLTDPLGFDAFSAQARAAGAFSLVTINYGSGTPAEASQWVAHSEQSASTAVALWEVGNESYSCYETNFQLAHAPTFIHDYTAGGALCPTTATMARSYVVNAAPFLRAMKTTDPHALIGVPWAFSGSEAGGAGVADADTWNSTVLHAFHSTVSYVDAHWYPTDQVAGLSDQQILGTVSKIGPAAAHLRSVLHRDAPNAAFVVGETNISERQSTLDFQPVAALFAAATSLEWLTQGAQSVVWWDLNNYGSATTGDFGLISSGGAETQPVGTAYPAYYGELLASTLAAPGSRIQAIPSLPANQFGFRSDKGGMRHILMVNSEAAPTAVDASRWFRSGTAVGTQTYSAATSSTPTPIVTSSVPDPGPVTLPAESIVVLSGTPKG